MEIKPVWVGAAALLGSITLLSYCNSPDRATRQQAGVPKSVAPAAPSNGVSAANIPGGPTTVNHDDEILKLTYQFRERAQSVCKQGKGDLTLRESATLGVALLVSRTTMVNANTLPNHSDSVVMNSKISAPEK